MELEQLLQLPFDVFWTLAVGYLAYRLAFVGRNSRHDTFDRVLLVVVFGSLSAGLASIVIDLAMLALQEAASHFVGSVRLVIEKVRGWLWTGSDWSVYIRSGLQLLISLMAASLWRTRGSDYWFKTLRDKGISDHDGHPSAWATMIGRKLNGPTRVVVYLKDGSALMCDNLSNFNDAPMGPCLFGEDGSVGLYVTDIKEAPRVWHHHPKWEAQEPFDPEYSDWGYSMTFVPATEIQTVKVTRP